VTTAAVAVTTVEEIIAVALTLDIPKLYQLMESIITDLKNRSISVQSEIGTIDLAADAEEDVKFGQPDGQARERVQPLPPGKP
jgi:hypothetical protein